MNPSPISALHDDVFSIIFQYCDISVLANCAKVNKYFKNILTKNMMWVDKSHHLKINLDNYNKLLLNTNEKVIDKFINNINKFYTSCNNLYVYSIFDNGDDDNNYYRVHKIIDYTIYENILSYLPIIFHNLKSLDISYIKINEKMCEVLKDNKSLTSLTCDQCFNNMKYDDDYQHKVISITDRHSNEKMEVIMANPQFNNFGFRDIFSINTTLTSLTVHINRIECIIAVAMALRNAIALRTLIIVNTQLLQYLDTIPSPDILLNISNWISENKTVENFTYDEGTCYDIDNLYPEYLDFVEKKKYFIEFDITSPLAKLITCINSIDILKISNERIIYLEYTDYIYSLLHTIIDYKIKDINCSFKEWFESNKTLKTLKLPLFDEINYIKISPEDKERNNYIIYDKLIELVKHHDSLEHLTIVLNVDDIINTFISLLERLDGCKLRTLHLSYDISKHAYLYDRNDFDNDFDIDEVVNNNLEKNILQGIKFASQMQIELLSTAAKKLLDKTPMLKITIDLGLYVMNDVRKYIVPSGFTFDHEDYTIEQFSERLIIQLSKLCLIKSNYEGKVEIKKRLK